MPALLLIPLLALILTKLADIVTTVRGIRRAGGSVGWERNPLARWAMLRWGVGGGIIFVMVLWAAMVALCYVPAWFSAVWYQWATALGGFVVAWCQWEVARTNATGRQSWFTRLTLRLFNRCT